MSIKKGVSSFFSVFGVGEWIEFYKSNIIEVMSKIKFGDDVYLYIWVLRIL